MRRLYVLRPEPGASRTVERARAFGIEAVATPLFEVEPLAWEPLDPGEFDALLLTSANALRYGGPNLSLYRRLPVHAVGAATARTAREAGFQVTTVGNAGIEALLAMLPPQLKLLHLCGRSRRRTGRPVQAITPVEVYEPRAILSPGGLEQVAGAVAMLHSPRAAARFADVVSREARPSIALAAISQPAAEAAGAGWERVEVAPQPSGDALLALAARLCDTTPAK